MTTVLTKVSYLEIHLQIFSRFSKRLFSSLSLRSGDLMPYLCLFVLAHISIFVGTFKNREWQNLLNPYCKNNASFYSATVSMFKGLLLMQNTGKCDISRMHACTYCPSELCVRSIEPPPPNIFTLSDTMQVDNVSCKCL